MKHFQSFSVIRQKLANAAPHTMPWQLRPPPDARASSAYLRQLAAALALMFGRTCESAVQLHRIARFIDRQAEQLSK